MQGMDSSNEEILTIHYVVMRTDVPQSPLVWTLSACLDTTIFIVDGPVLVVENGLRVCKGSQKVVQAKEIIDFHNNL